MAIRFELYKTPRPEKEGEQQLYHARVVNFQHIDTEHLASEIQLATSLTIGDVKSVLTSLSHFMGRRLCEGERIHLDGIGYFQVSLNSNEPITSPTTRANQMSLTPTITFRADKDLKGEIVGIKLQRTKMKLHSASRSNVMIDKLLTNYFKENQFMTRSDFQSLCSFTATTASRQIKRLKEEKKLVNINTHYHPIYVPTPGHYGKLEIENTMRNTSE